MFFHVTFHQALSLFISCVLLAAAEPVRVTARVTLSGVKAKTSSLAFNKPKPPVLQEVILHQSISIICEAASINGPAPTVYWQHKGQIVSAVDSEELKWLGNVTVVTSSTKSVLYIDCITPADLGLYSCIAETKFTRIVADTNIVLLPGHLSRIGHVNRARCEERLLIDSNSPRILMWSRNTLQKQGTVATLFCRAIGNPLPTITWEVQHGEPELVGQISRIPFGNKKHKILDNGDLQIFDLSWHNDMGNYICTAQNSVGTDRAEAFLYPVKPVSSLFSSRLSLILSLLF